jgi:hypothetical protein
MADAFTTSGMKKRFHRLRESVSEHRMDLEVSAELFAGGIFIVLILRWLGA